MCSYGFCIADNKYDSYVFRMKLAPSADRDMADYSELVLTLDKEKELIPSEEIRLKFDVLNPVVLGLLRTLYKPHSASAEAVLLTKPTDVGFERLVLSKYLGLMEFLLYMKERRSTLEDDLSLLRNPDASIAY